MQRINCTRGEELKMATKDHGSALLLRLLPALRPAAAPATATSTRRRRTTRAGTAGELAGGRVGGGGRRAGGSGGGRHGRRVLLALRRGARPIMLFDVRKLTLRACAITQACATSARRRPVRAGARPRQKQNRQVRRVC